MAVLAVAGANWPSARIASRGAVASCSATRPGAPAPWAPPPGPRFMLLPDQDPGAGTVHRARAGVASDADPLLGHDVAHVVLAHRMVDDVHGAVVLDERVTRPLEWVTASFGRELLHVLPRPLRVVPRARDDDAVPGSSGLDVFPADALAHGGVAQAVAHLRGPTLVHPVRDGDREAGR